MTTNDERLGPYELIDELGRGGMAVVYRARDVARGREVALKVIHDERADDAHFRRRLLREARAAGAIEHPGVCEIYDVAEDRGRIYVAMELLRGETLRESLEAGPLDPAHALDLAIALADVVAAAHAGGVIHRDIKPDNI
ncbi:MAG: serine/threonine protein kinase, partial [Myxococcales bacterium]|nr:serine/threonine protein kinase [Myxococcales bacterium]